MNLIKKASLVLWVACVALWTPAQAQTNTSQGTHHMGQPTRESPILPPRQSNGVEVADTPITNPAVVSFSIDDTTSKADTTLTEKVADVIHDTVKTLLKAPVVQVPITLRSLIIPGILFTYGALTLNESGLRKINEEVHEQTARTDRLYRSPYTDDYLLYEPAAAVFTLNLFGVRGQNNLLDRSVIFGMSYLISNSLVYGIKRIGIETRPDSSDRFSFPSGHTGQAFISAEFLRQEYRGRIHWSAVAAGYVVAAGVGYLRMYHNKHWLSDVVAGAGVGIASARFSYYLYPAVKHFLFGSRKIKGDAMLLPTYIPGGGVGIAFVRQF